MRFEIVPVGPTRGAKGVGLAARPIPSAVACDEAGGVDAIPPTPPAEVLDAMGVAAQAHGRLAQAGREMRFHLEQASGQLTVEIHDAHGELFFTVPPSKVLDVASGGRV